MKNHFLALLAAATLALSALSTTAFADTRAIRGINWADPNGNEGNGRVVLPSGLASTLTTTQAAAVGTRISNAVKASGGTTIRMPINYWTATNTTYWPVYQAAINAIVANGCNVILCWWPPTGHSVGNTTQWYAMWDAVNTVYKNNTKVYYEPINEPVDYNLTDLCNLYAGFLTRYSPAANKCILDGTGYAMNVSGVGADSRLTNQLLGLHCYWWFNAQSGTGNWWDAYNLMPSEVGSYAGRTVITEIGVETFRTVDFWWQWQGGAPADVAFLTGTSAYIKDNSIGSIAWSGVNDIDTYRWYMGNNSLTDVNPGVANMFRYSWGLPAIWQQAIPNGVYRLQNRANSQMLDNLGGTANGSSVYQWPSGTSTNQKWDVIYAAGYYTFTCQTGGLCLDTGGNTADGSTCQQWSNGTSTNQQWQLVPTDSGYYKLVNRASGKCLDTGGQTANGAAMQLWYSNTSYNQQWRFVQ